MHGSEICQLTLYHYQPDAINMKYTCKRHNLTCVITQGSPVNSEENLLGYHEKLEGTFWQ